MKKTVTVILFFAVLCNLAGADGLSLGIRLVEQKIHFLNDDIEIKITLKNDSADTQRFRVADNRVFSLDFDVRTAINRPVDFHSESFRNERNSLKPVFYRDVSLAPGEEYSLVVKFGDYVALRDPGLYVVQAKFFPDLYMNESSPALVSNALTLNLRPAAATPAERSVVEAQLDKDSQREALSPDEVVAYMLRARQIDHWSKFFLYINLDELYVSSFLKSSQNRDQFNRLSESDKKARIEAYRNQIIAGKAEWYLVLRPTKFEVIQTTYTPFTATVRVRQWYQNPDYMEPREYVYTLRKANGIWEIVNYVVTNLNTGAR